MTTFAEIALTVPEVLLPSAEVDMKRWAVVACDQYTSQPDYWQAVEDLVGDSPSTLHMMLPELYLGSDTEKKKVESINSVMRSYLDNGVLQSVGEGFVLVDRKTSQAPSRKGLVVALDLEQYDYTPGASTLIRATEGTIVDRLPPRIRVREGAALELPHIMVLIDDPDRTVIEPLFEKDLDTVYDFPLMQKGGHITGRLVKSEEDIKQVSSALCALANKDAFNQRYGTEGREPLLYAMGDGNHSFATAKAIWEKLKENTEDKSSIMDHPARFALVELVNIHDAGLEFEPIHRVMFKVEAEDLIDAMRDFCEGQGASCSVESCETFAVAVAEAEENTSGSLHLLPYITEDRTGIIKVESPLKNLPVATLQDFLDKYLDEHKEAEIDYIHGLDVVSDLGAKAGNMGFYLPAIDKGEFFKTIVLDGVFPRKTFSMGEADEKRYYLECRKIGD